MSLSIIIPSYNEAENLKNILPRIHKSVSGIGCEYEIIIVDTIEPMDDTEEICKAHNSSYVRREGGNSYGNAIRTGLEKARFGYLLIMDADGSHDPRDIQRFYKEIENYDLIIGSRYIKGGNSHNTLILKLMSYSLNLSFRILFNVKVKDMSNSFRLYRSEQIKSLDLYCDNFDIVEEIIIKLNKSKKPFRIKEVPVFFSQREHGQSKRQLFKFILSYFFLIIRLYRVCLQTRK